MRTHKSRGKREPYAVLLDIVGDGMTIANKDNPLTFRGGEVAYFADGHWFVKEGEAWSEAPTQLHNQLEYCLSKGMFE